MLDGSWRIYHQGKLIGQAASTEIGEPFRTKRRRKDAKAAYDCHWVYLASKQSQAVESDLPAGRPSTRIVRHPGKAIGATRIA